MLPSDFTFRQVKKRLGISEYLVATLKYNVPLAYRHIGESKQRGAFHYAFSGGMIYRVKGFLTFLI